MSIKMELGKYRDFFEKTNYDILKSATKDCYYLIDYDCERGIVDFFSEIDAENIEKVIESLIVEEMDIFLDMLEDRVKMIRSGIEVDEIDEDMVRKFTKNLKLFVSIENKI